MSKEDLGSLWPFPLVIAGVIAIVLLVRRLEDFESRITSLESLPASSPSEGK
jgi:hypothetical protein